MSRKDLNKHDYSGSCAPGKKNHFTGGQHTFSVGIFKWIPKASGKGLKKSAVIHRVKGYTSDPQAVYDRAEKICDALDRGEPIPAGFYSIFTAICQK